MKNKTKVNPKYLPNLYNIGGQLKPSVKDVGALISGSVGLLTDSLNMAKGPDTTDQLNNIKSFKSDSVNTLSTASSNEELLSSWGSFNPLENTKLKKTDFFGNIASSLGSGASAGGSAGGSMGAGIGAGVGAITGLIGSLFGDGNRKKKQKELDEKTSVANSTAYRALSNKASSIESSNDFGALANLSAAGGSLNTQGGTWDTGMNKFSTGGTHEENPNQGIPQGIGENGLPNLVEEGEVKYKDYIFSNRLKPDNKIMIQSNLPKVSNRKTFAEIAEKLSKEAKERPNDGISQRGLNSSLNKLKEIQEVTKLQNTPKQSMQNNSFYNGGILDKDEYSMDIGEKVLNNVQRAFDVQTIFPSNKPKSINLVDPPKSLQGIQLNNKPLNNKSLNNKPKESKQRVDLDKILSYASLAPVVGNLGTTIAGLFGNNDPDYTHANNLLNNAPKVESKPIGNYLTYKPFDRDYYTNKMNATSSASRRDLENTSGGNRATLSANMLASDYNTQNQMGQLFRQSEEFNRAQEQQVEGFNRQTNQFNSESDLRAQGINANLYANLANTAAQLKQQEDLMSAQTNSGNLTKLLSDLGALGNSAINRRLIKNNPAIRYGTGFTGNYTYTGK